MSDVLAYAAIFGSWLSFGSFAVPMKWKSVVDAGVHPLVYQANKTFWTFVTSHLVLLFLPYEFTWYGLLSGLSWVPAGVAAVVAVQHAGIAIGQSVWQVTIIATSFVWGFAILHDEHVRSIPGTAFAVLAMVGGLVGMALAFNLPATGVDMEEGHAGLLSKARNMSVASAATLDSKMSRTSRKSLTDIRFASFVPAANEEGKLLQQPKLSIGIAAALFNGIWGGSNLVPSKYAPLHGIHFCISFGIGALIVNTLMIVIYCLVAKFWWRCPLPSPHFRVMALPGFVSGSLWSLGNFFSLYAVNALGQGIGYSMVQSSIIVAGLWGIFFYRELWGRAVVLWGMCCCVCIVGVLLLAHERV